MTAPTTLRRCLSESIASKIVAHYHGIEFPNFPSAVGGNSDYYVTQIRYLSQQILNKLPSRDLSSHGDEEIVATAVAEAFKLFESEFPL